MAYVQVRARVCVEGLSILRCGSNWSSCSTSRCLFHSEYVRMRNENQYPFSFNFILFLVKILSCFPDFPQEHPLWKAGQQHKNIFKGFLWHITPSVYPLQPWEVLQGWSNWLCCLMGDNISLWPYAWSPPSILCSPCLHALDKVCSALSSLGANGAARPYLQWPRRPGINHPLQRKKLASEQSPHNL